MTSLPALPSEENITAAELQTGDVVRHLAHELRQPLSALENIACYLQMTVDDATTPAVTAHVDRLQQMVENANFVLTDMIHLLEMAPPQSTAVDVAEIAAEVIGERWSLEGLEVKFERPPSIPPVIADPEHLRHVLRSMFQFFRRAHVDPQRVWLDVAPAEFAACISLRAHAPRVSPEECFHPLAPNQLLTCQKIAALNGGEFHCEREDHGQICMRVELPLAPLEQEL